MRRRLFLLCLPLIVAVMACGPGFRPPTPREPPPDQVYDATFDEVWGAVLETITDLEIPIENLEKASGFIRSDFMRFPEGEYDTFMDCGEVRVSGTWWPVARRQGFRSQARVTLLVREIEAGKVSIRLRALMRGVTGEGVMHECESTGLFEQTFFREFEQRIASHDYD
jgi:hypothetical protein